MGKRTRIRRRILAGAVAVGIVGAATAGPAAALPPLPGPGGPAPTASVVPNQVPVGAATPSVGVSVTWANFAPGDDLFILQCDKAYVAGVTPSYTFDCVTTSYSYVAGASQTGSGSTPMTVFHGQAPGKTWGCYAPSEPVPAGVTGYTDCIIRVLAQNTSSPSAYYDIHLTNAFFNYQLNPPVDVPESPLVVLLPLSGAIAVGGWAATRCRARLA